MNIETFRALVRPTVTWGLTAGFIAAAFIDKDAAALVAGPMGVVIGFYFRTRDAEQR